MESFITLVAGCDNPLRLPKINNLSDLKHESIARVLSSVDEIPEDATIYSTYSFNEKDVKKTANRLDFANFSGEHCLTFNLIPFRFISTDGALAGMEARIFLQSLQLSEVNPPYALFEILKDGEPDQAILFVHASVCGALLAPHAELCATLLILASKLKETYRTLDIESLSLGAWTVRLPPGAMPVRGEWPLGASSGECAELKNMCLEAVKHIAGMTRLGPGVWISGECVTTLGPTPRELEILESEATNGQSALTTTLIFDGIDEDGKDIKPSKKKEKDAPPAVIPQLKRYATILISEHQIVYVQETQTFYTFDKTHYIPRDPLFFGHIFEKSIHSQLSNLKNNNELIGILKRSCGISVEAFESSTEGFINFKNGHYDKKTKQITGHEQCPTTRYFTYCLPFDYDPKACAPKWEAFMHQCFNDKASGRLDLESVTCLHELMGHAISGDENWHDRLLLAVGPSGANGKGTIWNIMRALVGPDAYSALPVRLLCNYKERESLDGKLVNLSAEEPVEAFVKNEAELKALSSRDAVAFRPMYKKAYSKPSKAKLWMSCNEIPNSHDMSGGWLRRPVILHFDNKAVDECDLQEALRDYKHGFVYVKDIHLEEKLTAELPGIFNLAIKAYEIAKERGTLTIPRRSKEAIQEMADSDMVTEVVRAAFEECAGDGVITNKEIMQAFAHEMESRRIRTQISQRKVLSVVKQVFAVRPYRDKVARGFMGIRAKVDPSSYLDAEENARREAQLWYNKPGL